MRTIFKTLWSGITTALFLAHVSVASPEVPATGGVVELAAQVAAGPYVSYQEPDFLTFDELKTLSQDPEARGALEKKLKRFWTTPIVSNEARHRGARPHRPRDLRLGHTLRVVSWNIEKSFHIDEVIQLLQSEEAYKKMIDPKQAAPGSETYREMLRQRKRLLHADLMIFQEMDIGVKRSGYKNAAAELAAALNMNYAYGAQYLEIDPVTMGLEELEFEEDDKAVEKEARDFFSVDPSKYKGVFGSAVLSRYPIKHAEVRPLATQPYDWYWGEMQKAGATEVMRRVGTKVLFKNAIQRELKVGGRHYFRVDLEVPDLPGKTLTVINIHLEIKCLPDGRKAQMEEILGIIREIPNPVVVMGDFNMAPTDISPTTAGRILKRTASNPTSWFTFAVNVLSPHALVLNTMRTISNFTKNLNDPTAKHIPMVAPNPMRPFFEMMEAYRFKDGGAFDFRGDEARSMGFKEGKLANANQRGHKGFVTSFRVLRPIGMVGKYRLDWLFVKAYQKHPFGGPYRFAPHFGETLEDMNYNLILPVSDHAPNVADLPFEEPKI